MNSVELLAPHLGDGTGLVAGYSFRGDKASYGDVVHIAMDAASPSSMSVLGRLFLTTTTGTVQFMQQDKLQWTREESLSNLELVQFVELPENKLDSGKMEEERFLQRLDRQLRDAQVMPVFILRCIRVLTGAVTNVGLACVSGQVRQTVRNRLLCICVLFSYCANWRCYLNTGRVWIQTGYCDSIETRQIIWVGFQ